MSKLKVEECRSISIFRLKEWGYLKKGISQRGGVKWTSSCGDENNISFWIDLNDEHGMSIELDYRTKGFWDDDWTDIKHKYPIVTTQCNYGGERYWFICSVYKSGRYCGRRVAKLFKGGGGNYFACRHCYDLAYSSQIDGWAYSENDLDELGSNIKRWCYNGRPTKKHLRYNRMSKAINRNWGSLLNKISKK